MEVVEVFGKRTGPPELSQDAYLCLPCSLLVSTTILLCMISCSGLCEEYVQWLQMTAKGFRDAMSLECAYGRTPCAEAMIPLACMRDLARKARHSHNKVLATRYKEALNHRCVLQERPVPQRLGFALHPAAAAGTVHAFGGGAAWSRHGARMGQLHKHSNCSSPNSGVSSALKLLTALFIGGASSCTALLSCRQVDGGSHTQEHVTWPSPHKDACSEPQMSEETELGKRDRWRALAGACLPRGLATGDVRRKGRRGSLGALGFPSS